MDPVIGITRQGKTSSQAVPRLTDLASHPGPVIVISVKVGHLTIERDEGKPSG